MGLARASQDVHSFTILCSVAYFDYVYSQRQSLALLLLRWKLPQTWKHLPSWDGSEFVVVWFPTKQQKSSTLSLWINIVKIHPTAQNSEWKNVLRSRCQSRHLWNILKQMAPQELDKVLSVESYAEVKKRKGDDNELDSLKIMPLNSV